MDLQRTTIFIFWLLLALPLAAEQTLYTCPMHPHYIAQEMGTCPLCGMDLVPARSAGGGPQELGEELPAATVRIAPETIQNLGVQYGRAEPVQFGKPLRAYGIIVANERNRSEVASRVAGWIEELGITAVGDPVRPGMLLYRLFSPDLIAAQRDYLSALERDHEERTQAAALRLRALGVGPQVIAQLRRERRLVEQTPFYAESGGTLAELPVRTGSYLRPGDTLFVLQDYTSVWLHASVAEKDLATLHLDTPVRITLPNLPGRLIEGKIAYLYPTIDPSSRTGTLRIELDNHDGQLRPGAYADLLFAVDRQQRLAVPTSALLIGRDGRRVIVALGEGRFQPRAVRTGLSDGHYTEILEGLEADERIVVSGQFLIDSESTLRNTFARMQRRKQPLIELPLSDQEVAMIDHLIDAALYLHEALIDGYSPEPNFLQPAREIRQLLWRSFRETRLGPILEQAEQAVRAAQQARSESELHTALDQLTRALEPWIREGRPQHYQAVGVTLWRESAEERLWLQLGEQPFNPYGGAAERIPLAAPAEESP